ncbi:hypothetical protein OQA88_12547 [Cercophora sp. LCS_1]
MNRFRTKKRAKDDASAGRPSQESEHSSSSFFRRGKKQQPEEIKPEIDIATALPSNDDFRTSLLMTNLSARFSMLREQDDPTTKIGKASDDSVLYPKRQSRMADFGFSPGLGGGLSDIAEVESIKASRLARTGSYASDDPELGQGASVMNRSKPTEGNNLFGGRQKIYKIPAGKSGGGGMVGRALYEDDVALSAFQRWRKAERERRSFEGDDNSDAPPMEDDAEPLGYNRKRETSSTTSSSSLARNSTAATSITSQQTGALKDWQSTSTAPTSAASTPALDRSVTRTRRLYEQVAQEAQEASPALSKMDAFTRQKPFGARTPDLGTNSPSPTANVFSDRLFSERRAALAKVSAPNLKTVSPPLSSTSTAPSDLGPKPVAQLETKPGFGASPPLSPPISEGSDQPQSLLTIQPNDHGKATAMGVFQKPAQPYDESKYAQRQIQLQQGRETPTGRLRAESNASFATARSRSTSSAQRQNFEVRPEPVRYQPALVEETVASTPAPESALPHSILSQIPAAQANIERPNDMDHPAFRQSPALVPLTITTALDNEPSPVSSGQASASLDVSPETQEPQYDSPTLPSLGPTNGGLSGLVRQHLRSESNASSIYGPSPPVSGFEAKFPSESEPADEGFSSRGNPFTSPGQEWTASFYSTAGGLSSPQPEMPNTVEETKPSPPVELKGSRRSSDVQITEEEADEFANQLADARRRVREKLTSYVDSDSSRAGSPLSHADSPKDLPGQAASNPLGIGMPKPKNSKGSLIDRSRNLVSGQSKASKVLGLGSTTMSASPNPSRQVFEEKDTAPLETMEEVPKEVEDQAVRAPAEPERGLEGRASKEGEDDSGNAHPGLKAFRQARRELQRRKELETLARHQATATTQSRDPSFEQNRETPRRSNEDRGPRQRTPSRERRPPPVSYRQRAPSEEHYGTNPNSPTASKTSSERDRSGSVTGGSRSSSRNRPPRLRGNTGPSHDQFVPAGPPGQPMFRAPGLPGTDIRNSPIMPPQGYPGRAGLSPAPSPSLHGSKSAGNLAVYSGRPGYEPNYGLPSPISPLAGGLPPSPYGPSPVGTPTTLGPRPRQASASQSPAFGPSGTNGPPRRPVDKRDISEPTFVMSTSRVPTVNLPQDGQQRPFQAPPVPPINPRRRETSRPRHYDDGNLSAPRLPFASQGNGSTSSLDYSEDNRSAFTSEDEDGSKQDQRRRFRKPPVEAPGYSGARNQGMPMMPGMRRDNSPPFVAKGPPASRTVVTSNAKVTQNMNVPGGMF